MLFASPAIFTDDKTSNSSNCPPSRPLPPPKYRITETQWGIWNVLTEHRVKSWSLSELPTTQIWREIHDLWTLTPVVRQFLLECYSLAPVPLVIWLLTSLFISMSGAASLLISSMLLDVVEGFIEGRKMEKRRLVLVAAGRMAFSLIQWISHEVRKRNENILRERLNRHMAAYKVRVYARLDLPTLSSASVRSQLDQLSSTDTTWKTLYGVTVSLTKLVTIASQMSVLLAVFRREKGGVEFALLALVQPLVVMLGVVDDPMPAGGVFAVFQANPYHKRMTDMRNILTSPQWREEIIGSGLREYLLNEYNAAEKALGDTPIGDPWQAHEATQSYWRSCLPWLTMDLPWILFACYAYFSAGTVPLKALMLLEQSVTTLTYQLQDIFRNTKSISAWIRNLKQVYDAIEIENIVKDGVVPYPRPDLKEKEGTQGGGGMKIEFRNVSFTYPDTYKPAIRNMSFTLRPGQLCVVVGENGCGKSSTTKLLLRLFDPSEGTILIDDLPIQEYRAEDLRKAMTVLYQGYVSYPLSIGENIGVGCSSPTGPTPEAIREAARLGNAIDFIEALPHGFDTNVEGTYPYRDTLYNAAPDSLLQKRVSEMENETRLSGGEWQRLALSRTFIRSEGVRLGIYDEASSSLDPVAEFELFEQLRALKRQRTMFFITHRFGHLTKYADVILYIKDGTILEHGSHEELLAAEGEYASMFHLQLKAYAPPSDGSATDQECSLSWPDEGSDM